MLLDGNSRMVEGSCSPRTEVLKFGEWLVHVFNAWIERRPAGIGAAAFSRWVMQLARLGA